MWSLGVTNEVRWRAGLDSRLPTATFEGDQEGDDFEKFITREIEEPGQAAIEKLVANVKMKPADWYSIARFVAAQQMRTPLYFIEWTWNTMHLESEGEFNTPRVSRATS
jgi:hypothetical protein